MAMDSEFHMCWSDSDGDALPSPSSSEASLDDDELNRRLKPYWQKYDCLFKARGLHLDTVRDVRPYYIGLQNGCMHNAIARVLASNEQHDHDLFADPSLPDNLFRGQRVCDGKRFVVKAVHSHSREYHIIQFLSRPCLREDPTNHTIPLIDMFEYQEDRVAFIVMEQWSPHLFTDSHPCCLQGFLAATRQLIEHIVFMHKHRLAHLDISSRNVVTDHKGHHAFIDFELSRIFESGSYFHNPGYQATEMPPECESRQCFDPFKMDVWALGVLILRACKMSGFQLPEILQLTRPMLHDNPDHRPPIHAVLETFDKMIAYLRPRLRTDCSNRHYCIDKP